MTGLLVARAGARGAFPPLARKLYIDQEGSPRGSLIVTNKSDGIRSYREVIREQDEYHFPTPWEVPEIVIDRDLADKLRIEDDAVEVDGNIKPPRRRKYRRKTNA